jgi:hypothetical protein
LVFAKTLRRLWHVSTFSRQRSSRTARDVGVRLCELPARPDELTAALRTLEESQEPTSALELLDAPPITSPDMARVSDERARALFDASRLENTPTAS